MHTRIPLFLFGTFDEVNRATKDQGRRWAKQLTSEHAFAVEKFRELADDEAILTSEITDWDRNKAQVRLYLIRNVLHSALKVLEYRKYEVVTRRFHDLLLGFGWGAIHLLTELPAPNNVETVSMRIQSLSNNWNDLNGHLFVSSDQTIPIDLETLIKAHLKYFLALWGDTNAPDLQQELVSSIKRLQSNDFAAAVEKLPNVLSDIAQNEATSLKHPAVVQCSNFLRQEIEKLSEAELVKVLSGFEGNLVSFIHDLDQRPSQNTSTDTNQ